MRRAALLLVATCCATAHAASDGNTTTTPVPVVTNATASAKQEALAPLRPNQCEIAFTYWEVDGDTTFDINFVHTLDTDHTTEWLDGGPMPGVSSNVEIIWGQLNLVQVWPRKEMACVSHIKLECGYHASGYNENKSVVITADAIQESWIRKSGGQRKPVNWAKGPCLYFRSDSWDKGAFRALDIHRGALLCGNNYRCVADNLETFSN